MAAIERTYNVPLRKGFSKAPKYKKTKKAVTTLREFLARHMKCSLDDIKLGKQLNQALWTRGYKYPPHHVKLTVIKSDDGKVRAELFGFKYDEPVKAEKQDKEKKSKEETKKEIADIKKEVDKVIDVDKVEEPAEKLVKKERKPRAKKTETKEETAATAESAEEKAEKKVRKPRAKKTSEPKEEKTE
jgi:ribosomal protein L31E